MNKPSILFVHRSFPGQFLRLAPFLAAQGWSVYALSGHKRHATYKGECDESMPDVAIHGYRPLRDATKNTHTYLRNTDRAILEGQGAANTALSMKAQGISPDIIVVHSGWGSGSFAKAVWPDARFVTYIEWWYSHPARDVDPKPRGTDVQDADARARTLSRNLPFMLDAVQSDAIICPTQFQAADMPQMLRAVLHFMPDGVDCDFFHPQEPRTPRTPLSFGDVTLSADTPVVTYATRGMEPARGFPEFMAAWAKVQHMHPKAHCVIAGTDSVHYSATLPAGESYLKRALVAHDFDMSRLHLVGKLPLAHYAHLLRRSDCHVYLTRPFVLSWSLSEAMASGCSLVVSDVEPVKEALPDAALALHVDHADVDALSAAISQTLSDPQAARTRGTRARSHALAHYNSERCMADIADLLRRVSQKSPALVR